MAYNKRPGNLFHNITGSQSSQAPTQPGIGGMGEVESPNKYVLPIVRGALAAAGRTGVGQLVKQGGKRMFASGASRLKNILGKGKPSIPEYASKLPPPKSFLTKAINTASNIGIGVGLGSFFGSSSSDSKTKMGETGPKVPTGGKKYDTNIKDFALNSQARRDEYTKRNWKQDSTTTVKGGNKSVSEIKSKPVVKSNSTPTAEVKINPMPSSTKPSAVEVQKDKNKIDRKSRSIDKKQDKIDQATASGNDKKARRKQRSLDNKKARLSDKGQLDAKYMSNLSGGDESNKEESPVKALSDLKPNLGTGKNQINPNSEFGKKIASAVPYTSRIQASAKWRKPNAAGQYDK